MVVGAMSTVKWKVMACFERFQKPGMVSTCIDVAANGTVEHVGSGGDLAGTDEARCVEEVVRSVRFAPQGAPWSTVYPYVMR
jgi:hypothetical protein